MKKVAAAVACAIVLAVGMRAVETSAAGKRLLIIPAGSIDRGILSDIRDALSKVYGRDADVGEEIRPPSDGYDNYRRQYSSTMIMNALEGYNLFRNIGDYDKYDRMLVVIDEDIFAPGREFVYGDANPGTRRGVMSLKRLREEFYNRMPDRYGFALRAKKIAVRVVGSSYGLGACAQPQCAMHGIKKVEDLDTIEPALCADCQKKFRALTKGTY